MALLVSLEGSSDLTLGFSGLAVGLVGDSFLSLGRSVERGFRSRGITEFQVLNTVLDVVHGVWTGKDSETGFGCTRLICASFGSTRLICASFGSTRLICAFYGTTRRLCRVGVQRGADRREAGRMREGHMDASDFLSLPLWPETVFCKVYTVLMNRICIKATFGTDMLRRLDFPPKSAYKGLHQHQDRCSCLQGPDSREWWDGVAFPPSIKSSFLFSSLSMIESLRLSEEELIHIFPNLY
ncbi:hypothetical protein E6C27_scaffold778G00170 [Cucumis melo var. makuwa]|uniref:Uncharacterized protein n=1 Tax=Cucumis melo var. makuwa TaxID=1194695 RepID=A0A5A7UHS4_CUCMM|nr:hypothetical protein E6C27_scaffold778G00170 [Cucumis melo var. makuwa]